jgi:hypothetical protein
MIWRMYYRKAGGHVHCRLFCGVQEGALGKCGDLTMRVEEFDEFFTKLHPSRTLMQLALNPMVMDFRRETDSMNWVT